MSRHFLRSFFIILLVWISWHALLFYTRPPLGVEAINTTFLRLLENFANRSLIKDVVSFLAVEAFLVASLTILVFCISVGAQKVIKLRCWPSLLLAAALVISPVHLLNSIFYPISKTAFHVDRDWAEPLLLILTVSAATLCIVAILRSRSARSTFAAATIICAISYFTVPTSISSTTPPHRLQAERPNIIIIGIDALRPSDVSYFGAQRNVMPFLNDLLESAEVYSPAYTPVARTHAAWMSILSGLYPLNNGARFNLTADSLLKKEHLLPRELQKLGYHTVWGLDERRFNSIDETYGFDKVVGPKAGAADFLITKISDIPIINILANTDFAKKFMPYIYTNRGNYVTYVPYVFNDELLDSLSDKAPNFLAAHLTLPHYPFVNNLMRRIEVEGEMVPGSYPHYLSMLELADRQLKDLVTRLAAEGHLEDAILYVVSDHGEGFPGIDEELNRGNPYAIFETSSFGHGTNVLSQHQYEVLMAKIVYRHGQPATSPNRHKRLSSLVDLSADIAASLELIFDTDGIPLSTTLPKRSVFLESSFSPRAVSASRISELQVLQQSVDSYELNEKGQLRLQSRLYRALSAAKQRAAVSEDGIMVALFPDEQDSALVVDTKSQTWWPSATGIPDNMAGWKRTLSALCAFYAPDTTFQHRETCERMVGE